MNNKELYERLEVIRRQVESDPEMIRRREQFARELGTLSYEQLHRPMTI